MRPDKPLVALLASDLMSREVLTIPRDTSVGYAARLLSRAHVSGAPVVDSEGRCVGVVSNTDFMHLAQSHPSASRPDGTPKPCVCSDWQVLKEEDLGRELDAFVTRDPVTVPPDTPIRDLARMMVDAHIHRVIVIDRDQHPIGVVSSMDVLAALARAENPS